MWGEPKLDFWGFHVCCVKMGLELGQLSCRGGGKGPLAPAPKSASVVLCKRVKVFRTDVVVVVCGRPVIETPPKLARDNMFL